jgi:hypothetical protein
MRVTPEWLYGRPNGEMDSINVDDEFFDYAGNMTGNADASYREA